MDSEIINHKKEQGRISLKTGNFPEDLKRMSLSDMDLLSYEIRDFLIESVSKTGGHLASNLGVVELTLALHRVFDSPRDKIIWDVGHQSYVHKILTGRIDEFKNLRQFEGLSGFPKRKESSHDCYDTGHSSNSISAAAGMATARDLRQEDYQVVAVIGDGALTGGLAWEALNNLGTSKSKLIIVLNDNGMSISKNIGGLSQHLTKLRTSKTYLGLKQQIKKVKGIPKFGESLYTGMETLRNSVKQAVVEGALFEELGIKYLGPYDGHNLEALISAFYQAKKIDGPVILHVHTVKGKGYRTAEDSPDKFHGVSPFNPSTGRPLSTSKVTTYSEAFGNKMMELAREHAEMTVVCAAMIKGTGLENFSSAYPDRIFDVGIAEGHAVSYAAGQAAAGLHPVVAIYSTFLQRAYDQVLIDVCMQNLPVVFALDRGGIVGADGETHHGVFDISYLQAMPNMEILSPADEEELCLMLDYAMKRQGPCAIRYPRGQVLDLSGVYEGNYGEILKNKTIKEGKDCCILASGRMLAAAYEALDLLKEKGIDAGLVNARSLKPLDRDSLRNILKDTSNIITVEDGVIIGGFGQQVDEFLRDENIPHRLLNLGWPDSFIQQGSDQQLFEKYGLDGKGIAERVGSFIEG